ncbi:MAG: hypothetical protein QXO22_08065 [Thermosphaera sp.]
MGTSGSYGSTGVNDSPLNNPPKTNLKKESVNLLSDSIPSQPNREPAKQSQQTGTHSYEYSNYNIDINITLEEDITASFSVRIPVSVYLKYRHELTGSQKRLVRELLRKFITDVILNIEKYEGRET